MSLPLNNYQTILTTLKEKIRQARFATVQTVNVQLLIIYAEIGRTILEQESAEGWGAKTVERLSVDLRMEFSDMKGLSPRNLRYMREFAKAYPAFSILQAPLAKLPGNPILQASLAKITWYHHITLLDKVKNEQERFFYINKTIENGWSRNILVHQIETDLYKRQGNAITNFEHTLPKLQSDLARETLKNPYVFDFLNMTEEVQERDLEKALIQHLKKFMLELGRGFAYVGNQKNIVVDGDDFFLDLLFFNYNLNRFVIFELKVGDFKPEFAGKLNFYVNTINQQLKTEQHQPAIGVLLCKTPNKTVIEYSLKGIASPIGVADYELSKALPKQLKSEMPSIAELEAEIEKEYQELKTPAEKRFDKLKEKVAQLQGEETKQGATIPIVWKIIDKSILPLYEAILNRMARYKHLFLDYHYNWHGTKDKFSNFNQLAVEWKNEELLNRNAALYFSFRLNGLKKAGTEAFSTGFQLDFRRDNYWYGFILINHNNQQPIVKKLYHQQLTPADIETIVETVPIAAAGLFIAKRFTRV